MTPPAIPMTPRRIQPKPTMRPSMTTRHLRQQLRQHVVQRMILRSVAHAIALKTIAASIMVTDSRMIGILIRMRLQNDLPRTLMYGAQKPWCRSFVDSVLVEGIVTGAMPMMWRLQVGVAVGGSARPNTRWPFEEFARLTNLIDFRLLYTLLCWTMRHHHSSRIRTPVKFT